jgi:cyclase
MRAGGNGIDPQWSLVTMRADRATRIGIQRVGHGSAGLRIAGNLHRACAELEGVAPGVPGDLASALAGMVTYKGGHPEAPRA